MRRFYWVKIGKKEKWFPMEKLINDKDVSVYGVYHVGPPFIQMMKMSKTEVEILTKNERRK